MTASPPPPGVSPRLARLAVAVGVALVLAFVITLVQAEGSATPAGRLGGDYAAFYAAGRIVADGDVEDLYEFERLQAEQHEHELLGEEDEGFIGFPYAPYVAAVYQPLSALPYQLSYAIHTALMVGALVLTVLLLRPVLPVVAANTAVVVVAAAAFFPMFRALGGGQNTAFSLLLIVAAWRAVRADRDVVAGVALGVLLYKPQLAVPLVGLFLLRGRWALLGGLVPVAAGVWLVNAALAGTDWVGSWLEGVGDWSELEAEFNAENTISVPGVAETLFGHGSLAAQLVGWSLAGLVVLALAGLWWRWPVAAGLDLALPVAVATAGLLLISPHAVYYEAGLLVLTGLVLVDRGGTVDRRWVAGLWLAGWLHPLNAVIGVSPLFFLAVAAFAVAAVAATRRVPVGAMLAR